MMYRHQRWGLHGGRSRRIRTTWHGGECQCTGGLCEPSLELAEAAQVSNRFRLQRRPGHLL